MANAMPPCNNPWCTTPWQWWPYNGMATPRWNDKEGDGGEDQGIMYLWSPLAIFCVALGLLVAVILIVLLAVMIYNYCTYGMCCCPSCAGQGSGCCCAGPMCCATQPEKTVVISRRRGSQDSRCSGGSTRSRRPRQQIIVDDGRSGDDEDNISIVSRPNIDRKIVRIADSPEVHTIKVHRPQNSSQQQPIILQPQIFVQSPTIQPAAPSCPPPQQRPPASFQGGELRVVIGNGYQQQGPSGASSKPLVFNMANKQTNEYVLTSVDNGGNNGGFSVGNGGGFNAGNKGGFSIGMQSGNGFYGGDLRDCGYQDDRASSFSDGQRSAIIDIGHGVRNSFYPSLPRYDE